MQFFNFLVYRYARAERDLKQARPYGIGAQSFYQVSEVDAPKDEKKELYIAVTSDRGLCGAVHTGIARFIRNELNASDNKDNTKIICIGEKSKAVLQRLFADKLVFVANEVRLKIFTFLKRI